MEPFHTLDAVALPILQPNLDTDQIIPARFLRKPRSEGCGRYLFHDLRFHADGSEESSFLLNQSPYRESRIVVAARNFGCGSSRENAVWALHDYGIRVVIAPSFGDIFAINCLKNGLVAIPLAADVVARLLDALVAAPGAHVGVDLKNQTVKLPGDHTASFAIDPFAKHCLLDGLDELGYTMSQIDRIAAFERRLDTAT